MTKVTTTAEPERTRVAVIGAGQAGLSVAWHLRRLGLVPGVDLVVLDRGPGPGGAWQHRWDSLRLGSAHRVNDLPGMSELGLSFDTADRDAPASQIVADYYERYERAFDLRVRRPAEVRAVGDRGGGLAVRYVTRASSTRASSGDAEAQPIERELVAEVVVNASGTWGAPFVPWYPGRDRFAGRQLHTADYHEAGEFEGLDVVVVGGGTSAIGFVLELEGVSASTTWVTRRPVEWQARGEGLAQEAAVAAVAEQDEAARRGATLPSIVSGTGVPLTRRFAAAIERGVLVERPMFTSIEPDGVRFADGELVRADAIIWATGFRAELHHLSELHLREQSGGVAVRAGVSERDPRIFLAGYGPQASTIGANRAGRSVARQVMARLEARVG